MSTDSAADEAARAALHKPTVEHWTLYAIGVTLTLLRTYARVRAVGFRHLQAEDLLVWVGIVRDHTLGWIFNHLLIPVLSRYSTPCKRLLRTASVVLHMAWRIMA